MKIKPIVEGLARKYGTRDPFEIAEDMNAIILHVPLIGTHGFYQYFQRNHLIYIDEKLSDHEKRLVCAHELGHMVIHKKTNSYRISAYTSLNTVRYEKEANKFAMYLLIPDEDLIECRTNGYTITQLSRLYGYSDSLIKLRLEED